MQQLEIANSPIFVDEQIVEGLTMSMECDPKTLPVWEICTMELLPEQEIRMESTAPLVILRGPLMTQSLTVTNWLVAMS